MSNLEKLEKGVSKKSAKTGRHMVVFGATFLVLGAVLIYGGVSVLRGKSTVSADVANPPNPPDPAASSASVANPPSPVNPDSATAGAYTFPPGWSLVAGEVLGGTNMATFKDAGLILYSFNDVAYPNREWSTFPTGDTGSANIVPSAPYGYYVYNPGTTGVRYDIGSTTQSPIGDEMVARGWHLMYWPGEVANYADLMSKITLKYADGTSMTAVEAQTQENHRASIESYVIVDSASLNATTAVKLLGTADSDKTISKIPAKSFFWLYLRRTKERVVQMSIAGSTSNSGVASPPVPPAPTVTPTPN